LEFGIAAASTINFEFQIPNSQFLIHGPVTRNSSQHARSTQPFYTSLMSVFANSFDSTPEQVTSYIDGLLELAGDKDPATELGLMPDRIVNAIKGLTDAQLHQPEKEGKWAIAQVVQHLADSDLVVGFRLRMIVAHDTPPIPGYDQDRWAARLHYDRVKVDDALAQLRGVRGGNVRLYASLSPEERQRAGMHAERGRETAERLMRLAVGHDVVHLRQIERIKAAVE
jgi:hypothetical protein